MNGQSESVRWIEDGGWTCEWYPNFPEKMDAFSYKVVIHFSTVHYSTFESLLICRFCTYLKCPFLNALPVKNPLGIGLTTRVKTEKGNINKRMEARTKQPRIQKIAVNCLFWEIHMSSG